jgi:PleD family two-component response regulator
MKMKVLVVDDTRTARFREKMLMEELGCEVEEAGDGVEALLKIEADVPHIVLLDIMMPDMCGIECCREIKRRFHPSGIKVIMVTAEEDYEKIDSAFKAGCDDYVIKPIDREELLEKVRELAEFVRFRENLR